jgi:hypothetical protein
MSATTTDPNGSVRATGTGDVIPSDLRTRPAVSIPSLESPTNRCEKSVARFRTPWAVPVVAESCVAKRPRSRAD